MKRAYVIRASIIYHAFCGMPCDGNYSFRWIIVLLFVIYIKLQELMHLNTSIPLHVKWKCRQGDLR